MKNPSPLAARMLRAMIRHNVRIRMEHDAKYAPGQPSWIEVDGRESQLSLSDVKIKRSNVMAAVKNGWVVVYKTEETKWAKYRLYCITGAGREIIASLDEAEFYPKPPEISHDQLKIFMSKWYKNNHSTFLYLPEFNYRGSIIDGYGIALWHSLDFRTVAYEMKASRADLLAELRNPDKYRGTLKICHQFFFVTPRKLASTGEIPDPCGLIEINKAGKVFTILDSPHRNIHPPGWPFVAILLRHARKVYENKLDDAGHRKDRWH